MKGFLCNLNFMSDETLITHYIYGHSINANGNFFKDLFLPDNNLKSCEKCMMEFKSCRLKKNHMFLFHYNQSGGNTLNQQLPVNTLKRGPITYFSINFDRHKNFYNLSEEIIVNDFIGSVYAQFVPAGESKIQGYAEIINQQQGEMIISENKRVWLTNVYITKHFNPYVRGALKNDILKRLIFSGETGSSWTIKRFQRLQIITTFIKGFKSIISG